MEAGLAHAASLLEEDATWTEGFDQERMTRTDGAYTITFQDPGRPYQDGNSVNNIMGTEEMDGPRGPKTVIPGTVELVVHSRSGPLQNRGTFLMQAIFNNSNDWAVSSAGKIVMEGDIDVQGVENLATWAPVNAGIHANIFQAGETAVSWTPGQVGDRATFSGKVSTPTRGDTAIQFSGQEGVDFQADEFEDGAGRLAIQSPQIVEKVSNNASAPSPPVSPFGTTTLNAGEYYSGGALDLQGDLVLEGGTLYVNGDLNVNGSITGTGSVYVTGKTSFKGDAYIEAGAEGVALYSEGSITMSGFNGTEFMERLSRNNPGIIQQFNNAKAQLLDSSDTTPDGTQRNQANSALNSLRQVTQLVEQELASGGQTASFVKKQLNAIDDVVERSHDDNTYSRAEMGQIYREVSYGLDRVGTGYFKGLLVSNSYIHTDSAVAVVGCVWASGTNETDQPKFVDGREIKPGDVYLGSDTSLLLNRELVEDEDTASPTQLAGLEMLSWRQE